MELYITQLRDRTHVGGILDLGSRFHETGEKMFPWCFHGLEHRNRCRIVSYDDLLLPRHRLLAQFAIGASGEHFEHASAVEQSPRRRPDGPWCSGAEAMPQCRGAAKRPLENFLNFQLRKKYFFILL